MTDQQRTLLARDLRGRVGSGVIVHTIFGDFVLESVDSYEQVALIDFSSDLYTLDDVKPYLRPMDSMTDEEKETYEKLKSLLVCQVNTASKGAFHVSYAVDIDEDSSNVFDWLDDNHFDYRDLIGQGLAIAVTEEYNPYVGINGTDFKVGDEIFVYDDFTGTHNGLIKGFDPTGNAKRVLLWHGPHDQSTFIWVEDLKHSRKVKDIDSTN